MWLNPKGANKGKKKVNVDSDADPDFEKEELGDTWGGL